jgi:hypothetical protein
LEYLCIKESTEELENFKGAEEKYKERLNRSNIRHYNSLDIESSIIQEIINSEENAGYDINYIIQNLKMYYWTNFNSLEELENNIKDKFKRYKNIDKLIKNDE